MVSTILWLIFLFFTDRIELTWFDTYIGSCKLPIDGCVSTRRWVSGTTDGGTDRASLRPSAPAQYSRQERRQAAQRQRALGRDRHTRDTHARRGLMGTDRDAQESSRQVVCSGIILGCSKRRERLNVSHESTRLTDAWSDTANDECP